MGTIIPLSFLIRLAPDFLTTEDTEVFSQRGTELLLRFFAFKGHRAHLRCGRGAAAHSSRQQAGRVEQCSKNYCIP